MISPGAPHPVRVVKALPERALRDSRWAAQLSRYFLGAQDLCARPGRGSGRPPSSSTVSLATQQPQRERWVVVAGAQRAGGVPVGVGMDGRSARRRAVTWQCLSDARGACQWAADAVDQRSYFMRCDVVAPDTGRMVLLDRAGSLPVAAQGKIQKRAGRAPQGDQIWLGPLARPRGEGARAP